jgi:hypothetical protein
MLEHHSEENPETGYVHQPGQETETSFNAATSEEMEDYLDQVIAPLVRVLPRSKRAAIRAHLSAQLQASVAAHRELGATYEAAIQAAIRQAGDPELISQRWVVETRAQTGRQSPQQVTLQTAPLLKPPSARAATLTALGLFGLPYVADVTTWAGNNWAAHSNNTITYYRFFLFSVPLLAGLATGLVARNRPVRGVLNALAMLTIPAILLPGLVLGLSYANVFIDKNAQFPWMPNPLPGLCGLVPWMLLGSLGAAVGGRLHTRAARLRTRLSRPLRLHRMERTNIGQPPPKPYEITLRV